MIHVLKADVKSARLPGIFLLNISPKIETKHLLFNFAQIIFSNYSNLIYILQIYISIYEKMCSN